MGRTGRWMEKWMTGAGLQEENPARLPLAEICGDRRVLIENHGGVTTYSPQEITVSVRGGSFSVFGSDLRLCHMSQEKLVIRGRIHSIHLNRR